MNDELLTKVAEFLWERDTPEPWSEASQEEQEPYFKTAKYLLVLIDNAT